MRFVAAGLLLLAVALTVALCPAAQRRIETRNPYARDGGAG